MSMTYGEARSSLVTELLWSAAAQEQGHFERIGRHFDAMDRLVPRGDGADLKRLNIALSFLDGWVDARNHDWLYYEGIKRDDWPVEARDLAADLSADREIRSAKVLHHFSHSPQRSLRERLRDFMGRRQSARRENLEARMRQTGSKFVYSVPIGYDGPPPERPPPDLSKVTHLADLSATDWLIVSLYTFSRNLSRIIPGHFEAYARVYHPFREGHEREGRQRWADVAARTGRSFATPQDADDLAWGKGLDQWGRGLSQQAAVGEAPLAVVEPLLERVRVATTTPESCYFALWEGFGDSPVDPGLSPKLHLPDRAYHVFTGTVEAVLTNFSDVSWSYRSPNIWWPADRAWCVATEIDFAWTYVGGSRELIDAILADDRLEAVETSAAAEW
jgi:hypothetical protein